MIIRSHYRLLRAFGDLVRAAWLPVLAVMALFSLIAFTLYLRSHPAIQPEVVGTTTEARMAVELKKETTVPLQIEVIKVFEPKTKAKLKLPQSVITDPGKHVVASSKVGGDERSHTVTSVVDQTTGQFTTYDHINPLPWVAVRTHTHVAAYYGLKDGEQLVRLQAQQELLQTKSLHIEAIASVDIGGGKPNTFIGIGGRLRF